MHPKFNDLGLIPKEKTPAPGLTDIQQDIADLMSNSTDPFLDPYFNNDATPDMPPSPIARHSFSEGGPIARRSFSEGGNPARPETEGGQPIDYAAAEQQERIRLAHEFTKHHKPRLKNHPETQSHIRFDSGNEVNDPHTQSPIARRSDSEGGHIARRSFSEGGHTDPGGAGSNGKPQRITKHDRPDLNYKQRRKLEKQIKRQNNKPNKAA